MTDSITDLAARAREKFGDRVSDCIVDRGELTLVVPAAHLVTVCTELRDAPGFQFEELIDVCGVDYLEYGVDEWSSASAPDQGFSRGVNRDRPDHAENPHPCRFAAVYHLLSIANNRRLRVRCYCENDELPGVDSVTGVWKSADWFEREAFDLYGIVFDGHPDLRRILTDYGFIGHPFRKDFPLIGNVEMRYDPERRRTVYEPVSIEPRVTQPKIIREDSRYVSGNPPPAEPGSDS